MSKKLTPIALILLVVSIFLTYFAIQYHRFLITPLSKTEVIHYVFKPGSSMHRLVDDLQAQGFIQHPRFFYFLAYSKGATNKLKTGEYLFDPGTTPYQLVDQMMSGRVILHRFTIVEGWTFQQFLTALQALPYVKHTLNKTSPEQVLANLGLPPENPEGLFFPATYYFSLGAKDTDLLKWSYQLLEKKLNQEWLKRSSDLPYKTSYEALIAASLVEKETAIPKERPMISGVIARRLQKGIPLQIDASIIYGLGVHYTGKITVDDLRKDTPYNTYTRRGLPPTPIAIPSLSSIEATLHPDNSQNLYFVAKGDGSHQFSSNLAEHNRAVQIYQLDMRYPIIRKKTKGCQSLWYLSKRMKSLFCQLNEVHSH
ncbi:endolytic transglycosylase MltG [Rickettsiella endosymbiont of Dermanyssus gallinae]|uniref:endolytic transglycosylase MltG n=1 Tax=Rickettsiella endosymbiont of Dermanyssus gallinae TaxID=2856608 RepID=UPI001C5274C0|nr:endolytic transglycosylase MltG [Rickettsiella endosymbiont of Dermanyssus gallinae]